MTTSKSSTREKFPLSPKKVWKKTIASVSLWAVLLFVLNFLLSIFTISAPEELQMISRFVSGGSFWLFIGICTLTYLYQRWYFRTYFYELTDDFVIIRKDPITPREITIPYERIQDVYMDQDIWDRIFGLYDIHLSSATVSSGMEAHIDGVEKEAAQGLRDALLETVQKKIKK